MKYRVSVNKDNPRLLELLRITSSRKLKGYLFYEYTVCIKHPYIAKEHNYFTIY